MNSFPVLFCHRITRTAISAVTAYRHIIRVKWLLINIKRQSTCYHIQIALWPFPFNVFFHSIAIAHKAFAIAKVVMGNISRIISISIIMKSLSVITQSVKLTTHSHIIKMFFGIFKGFTTRCRQHTKNILIFTARSTCTTRLIIIGKINTFGSKSVKGRSEFGVNYFGGKSFGR